MSDERETADYSYAGSGMGGMINFLRAYMAAPDDADVEMRLVSPDQEKDILMLLITVEHQDDITRVAVTVDEADILLKAAQHTLQKWLPRDIDGSAVAGLPGLIVGLLMGINELKQAIKSRLN